MKPGTKFDVAKTIWWPGATPFWPRSCGPKSLRAFGVAPGHIGHVVVPFNGLCRVVCKAKGYPEFLANLAEPFLANSVRNSAIPQGGS